MAVIFKFSVADCPQPDGPLAAHVIIQVLINRSEVGGLALSAVVISGKENLVPKVQDLAPAAFKVFRGGGVRQSVGFHRLIDRHGCFLRYRGRLPFGMYIYHSTRRK